MEVRRVFLSGSGGRGDSPKIAPDRLRLQLCSHYGIGRQWALSASGLFC